MSASEPLFEPGPRGVYVPSGFTRGPWDPSLLHGGPVGALFAELGQDASAEGYQPVRLTVDLMRPVPIKALEAEVRVVRTGRRLQLIEASLACEGTPVARASLLLLSTVSLDVDGLNPAPGPWPPDGPDDAPGGWGPPAGAEMFVGGAMDFRFLQGEQLGSGRGWFRLFRDVLPGRPPSPLARAAAAADVGNALSARRGPGHPPISFVNADLSLSLSRLPVGEWIRLAASATWGAMGIGCVSSQMGDLSGPVGAVSNALVLQLNERLPFPGGDR